MYVYFRVYIYKVAFGMIALQHLYRLVKQSATCGAPAKKRQRLANPFLGPGSVSAYSIDSTRVLQRHCRTCSS